MIGSPIIFPLRSSTIVVGKAIMLVAYFPASLLESRERFVYFAPCFSKILLASAIPSSFPSRESVLIPITCPPFSFSSSFNLFSSGSSCTHGEHPLNQKFKTVTAFFEMMLLSTSFPSRSFALNSGNTLAPSLPESLFDAFALCFSRSG